MFPYRSVIFDCDGVLLNSNRIKTSAFETVGRSYGVGRELAEYHRQNGGLSRFEKFSYMFRVLLGRTDDFSREQEEALRTFSEASLTALLECEITPGAEDMLASIPAATRRYVVSGGKEDEVRSVLEHKGLARHFEGIFGSPSSKTEILTRLTAAKALPSPAIFFGDARLDHEVAVQFGMSFVFVSDFTQFDDWRDYCKKHSLVSVRTLAEWKAPDQVETVRRT